MESFASTSTSGGINIPEVQNQERTDECQQQSDEFDYNPVNQSQTYLTQLSDLWLHNSERARLIPKYYHHGIDYNRIHQIVVDIHQYVLDFELPVYCKGTR
jgi:hypothetical protein